MNLKNYILHEEIVKTDDNDLNKIFDTAMRNVFSKDYYEKIKAKLAKSVIVSYMDKEQSGVVAYNVNNKIFVSKTEFGKLNLDRKCAYLLHEFTHVLQRYKKLGFIKVFPEFDYISKKLYLLITKNLTGTLSQFLTGKDEDIGQLKELEVMAYTMNSRLRWEYTKPGTKEMFENILKESKIFNIGSFFWNERLK